MSQFNRPDIYNRIYENDRELCRYSNMVLHTGLCAHSYRANGAAKKVFTGEINAAN